MHAHPTPVHRKRLVDPAACGVRLGVELRMAAEQAAYGAGMCLSHWIKKLVAEAVSNFGASGNGIARNAEIHAEDKTKSAPDDLDSAYALEMEQLNDR
jgi:hypothetical protein